MLARPSDQVERVLAGAGVAPWAATRLFSVTGPDALDLLSRLSTQELGSLTSGRAVTTLFLSPTGRLLHRVLLQPDGQGLRAVAESTPGAVLGDWIERYTFSENCRVEDLPEHVALLLLGRRAPEVAAAIGHGGLEADGDQSHREELLLSRRAFGPLPGIVVSGPRSSVEDCAAELEEAGASALDEDGLLQLRVEAGVPAAGCELREEYHLLEAGLRTEASFEKGCYTGQEVVARQDSSGKVARSLVGLVFEGRPSVGDEIASESRKGCRVTSVAPAPEAEPPCLGYVRTANATEGQAVRTATGLEGRVVTLPFPRLRGLDI